MRRVLGMRRTVNRRCPAFVKQLRSILRINLPVGASRRGHPRRGAASNPRKYDLALPLAGTLDSRLGNGEVPEWPKGTVC
jgi:hypothetical protein